MDPRKLEALDTLEERARRLLRAKILFHHRSLLEFDRAIGDPPNTVSQRLRGRIRLTLLQLLRYLEQLEIHPVDFFLELCGRPGSLPGGRQAPTPEEIHRLIEQLAAAGQIASRLLERSGGTFVLPSPQGGSPRKGRE